MGDASEEAQRIERERQRRNARHFQELTASKPEVRHSNLLAKYPRRIEIPRHPTRAFARCLCFVGFLANTASASLPGLEYETVSKRPLSQLCYDSGDSEARRVPVCGK